MDKIPLWGVFLATLVITCLSAELGFRGGRRKPRRSAKEGQEIRPGPFAAAALGLLAFLLAMVYGSVESRLRSLKQVALDEANAIGTVYLRADLLPSGEGAEIRQMLREYVDFHTEAVQDRTGQWAEQVPGRFEELQSALWSRATTLAEEQPTPISALFVDSVNQLIDLSEKRITFGIHYRVPGAIWLVLYGLAVLAMAMGGYVVGLPGSHRSVAILLAGASAYSVVLVLVIALDRPLQVSMATESAMLDLQESIRRSIDSQP